jgi:Lar family restriction alleviation protein
MELKPCPFCGKGARHHFSQGTGSNFVECVGCEADTAYYDTREEAIAAWNTRAAPKAEPVACSEHEWTDHAYCLKCGAQHDSMEDAAPPSRDAANPFTDDPAEDATPAQLREAFEWLRGVSLARVRGSTHAARLMYRLAKLEARPSRGETSLDANVAEDAARYRWIRDVQNESAFHIVGCYEGADLDAAIDAARQERGT